MVVSAHRTQPVAVRRYNDLCNSLGNRGWRRSQHEIVVPHEFHFAAKRSQFRYSSKVNDALARRAPTRDQTMALRKTRDIAEHDQPVETNVEAEIREFVRRDVVASPGPQPESESHLVATNINAVLQGATATSVQEIEKLI